MNYPFEPAIGKTDTSELAALEIKSKAATLREKVQDLLNKEDLTADECAALLNENILAIRPRVTELSKQGKIFDSNVRRLNTSGKKAIVWTVKI